MREALIPFAKIIGAAQVKILATPAPAVCKAETRDETLVSPLEMATLDFVPVDVLLKSQCRRAYNAATSTPAKWRFVPVKNPLDTLKQFYIIRWWRSTNGNAQQPEASGWPDDFEFAPKRCFPARAIATKRVFRASRKNPQRK